MDCGYWVAREGVDGMREGERRVGEKVDRDFSVFMIASQLFLVVDWKLLQLTYG